MAALVVSSLSRRELQLLAKELHLCRGNAKSDVIMQHVYEFVAAHGEPRVLSLLGASSDAVSTTAAHDSDATDSDAPVPEAEPVTADEPIKSQPKKQHEEAQVTKSPITKSPKAKSLVAKSPSSKSPVIKSPINKSSTAPSPAATSPAAKSPKVAAKPAVAPTGEVSASPSPAAAKRKRSEPAVSPAKAPPASPATVPDPMERVSTPLVASKSKLPVASESRQIEVGTTPKTDNTSAPPALRRALASIENARPTETPVSVPADVRAFVDAADDLAFTKDGRVRCSTTAHEMKAELALIKEHLGGKRYARARGIKKLSLAAYAPMFREHPDEKLAAKLVWCDVTETAIVCSREQIEAHIAGPRYQKDLPQWREVQAAKAKAEAEAAVAEAEAAVAEAERAKKRQLAAKKRQREQSAADGKGSKRRAVASS